METITKRFDAKIEVDEGSREVVAVISTDSIDRDKDILLPRGLQKKNYGGNPIVMVNHAYDRLPIGTTRWIKKDGNRLIAKYFVSDKTEFARDVFGLLQDGVLRAHSVGFSFDPDSSGPPTDKELKANPQWSGASRIIRKWELHEFSVVSVPANPDCLALTVAKGYSPKTLNFLGDDFKEAPEVWRFDQPQEEPEAEQELIVPAPIYSKAWNEDQLLTGFDAENEILARLMGRP